MQTVIIIEFDLNKVVYCLDFMLRIEDLTSFAELFQRKYF